MATTDELIGNAQTRMGKSVEHARNEFATVRTGRGVRMAIIDTGFLTSLFGRGAEGGEEREPFTAFGRGSRRFGLRNVRAVRGRVVLG